MLVILKQMMLLNRIKKNNVINENPTLKSQKELTPISNSGQSGDENMVSSKVQKQDENSYLLKARAEERVNAYDVVQNNPNLSVEEMVSQINSITEAINREIDKEYRNKMAQYYGGLALEIGSYAIPGTIGAKSVSALTKALAPVAKKLTPKLGKKMSQSIVKSAVEGAISAPVASIGDEMLKEKDIPDAFIGDFGQSTAQSTGFGSLYSGANRYDAWNSLSDIDNITDLPSRQQRKVKDKANQYYKDHIMGTTQEKLPGRVTQGPLTDKQWKLWKKILRLK